MGKPIASISLIVLLFLSGFTATAQISLLKTKLETIAAAHRATIGLSISGPEKGDTLTMNGNRAFPMQSVFKFQVALAILHLVDEGKLSVDQKIRIRKADLRTDTWSPIQEKYPQGNIDMPLAELLGYTISQSDNNGCDILIRLAGGTAKVDRYIHSLGIKNMAIAATEAQMATAWNVQFTNHATPRAMAALLQLFYSGKILSAKSNALLMQLMAETSTGPKRLKGLLPAGTVVAHKTGTSDTNDAGITAATNDVGFITLPNGAVFTIVVFITNSHEGVTANEQITAELAKAAWDYFTGMRN